MNHECRYLISIEGRTAELICSCGRYIKSKASRAVEVEEDLLVSEMYDYLQDK